MKDSDFPFIHPRHPRYAALRALSQAVACIRKARGKPCHTDFEDGTPEYEDAIEDYARDVIQAFCADPDLVDFGKYSVDDDIDDASKDTHDDTPSAKSEGDEGGRTTDPSRSAPDNESGGDPGPDA